MGKLLASILLLTVVLVAISFAVVSSEGSVTISTSTSGKHGWPAIRLSGRDRLPRYVSISSTGLSGEVRSYHRRHFGWPMQALRIDSCSADGTWYAKLDACKFGVNLAGAAILALGAGIALSILRQRHHRRVVPTAEGHHSIVGRSFSGIVLGTILATIPFLSWWAYCYAYEDQFLFKEYRWLSDLGRHLRVICLSGLVIYTAAWFMLVRYCRGGRQQLAAH